jgi:serine/threonine protein kinase
MPAADRSLEHIISAERIAGVDIDKIRHFANGIGKALLHLHRDKGLVHADFKPRNIVRMHSEWKLIDFDAAVQVCLNYQHLGLYSLQQILSFTFIFCYRS